MPTEETQNIQPPDFPKSAYLRKIINAASIFPKIATIKKIPLRHHRRWVKPARLRIQGVVSITHRYLLLVCYGVIYDEALMGHFLNIKFLICE